jgi:hypothetical protein
MKSSAASRLPGRRAKSEAGDRRREAVVEGLGQPQPLVDLVQPSRSASSWTPQLAGVEETEQLDPAEVGAAELAELGGAVLAQVPGVLRLLGAGGARVSRFGVET